MTLNIHRVSLREAESPKGEEYFRILLQVKNTGMAITKYIVDAMGGTIEVGEPAGRGHGV